ncbi:hypothetical protein [Glaciecola sp. 33A]|jgi:hypothetical protein|uniref:hypothetical protein n=1 Tax=Glaciecola sp. 33A TaxID=2057807 RepID=UPI000C32046D|nr:hypothetical protein [Glaciecola sp. 33A]PKI01347.1 hypothetical protein CXF81_12670 [Glaciecola sp. 33A]
MKKTLLIFGFIAVFVAAFIWSLPASIDNDLNQIGNGKKSVVFIYDLNLVVSNQQTIEINNAKAELGDSVNYLVSRKGYLATDKFMQNYKAESAELLFFDKSGKIFKRKFALVNAVDLTIILASID